MKKFTKILGATTLATSLMIGMPAMDGADAKTTTKAESITPWYSYNGYIYNDPNVVLDKYFVQALKYDNVKLNGYKVNPNAQVGMGGKPMKIYDVDYLKDKKNRIGYMSFEVKPKVTKKAFMKAHAANKIVDQTKGNGAGYVKYKTNKANYLASFDKKGYLVKLEIGVIPQ